METSEEIVKLAKKIRNNRITFKQIEESKIKKEALENQVNGLKKDIKILKLNTLKQNRLLEQIKESEEEKRQLKLDLKGLNDMCKFIVTTPNGASETVSGEISVELSQAQKEVLICSPWITYLVDELSNLNRKGNGKKIKLKVITRLVKEDIDGGITDLDKLRVLEKNFGAEIRYNNNLHAKMIIIDNSIAIISSANLTKKGLNVNYEAGVSVKDKNMIEKSSLFFNDVWEKSEPLTEQAINEVRLNKGK
jgi:phosphatidylserine/phosphatidylglycerophosphate/cardiolipin synthase-like enzyme